MPLDGLFVHALAHEFNQKLAGGRITKVHQPYPNEIILVVRNNSQNYPVLLSAHPAYARAQVTKIPYQNPKTPTNFAMFLRRNLEGARLNQVEQVSNDRILHFAVNTHDELGDEQTLLLTLEMMGRHSNLFLVREKDQRILELIKHVPADQNRVRSLMPGATYTLPPAQNKENPFTSDLGSLAKILLDEDKANWAQAIQQHFEGFSTQSAKQLAQTLSQAADALKTTSEWLANFDMPAPTLYRFAQNKLSYSAFDWGQNADQKEQFASLGDLLDAYFAGQAEADRVNQQAASLVRLVKNELKKNTTKQKKLEQTLSDSENAESFKIKGDLLITYPHLVHKGMTSVDIENYYDDNKLLKIELDPRFDGLKNANRYFHKYRKLRLAKDYVLEQLEETKKEIDYFASIQTQLAVASPKDVEDIKIELIEQGYLREKVKVKTKGKQTRKPKHVMGQPDRFVATDGTMIEVGKNNLQNDRLSLKKQNRHKIWLHVQNLPGSHVLIDSDAPSEKTLEEAAQLAAYFSKARDSANVPVDYLPAGRLRKPNGAKPGYVIFEGQQTTYVTPDQNLISTLKKDAH
ncbi:NFACT family protein [Fructobacillus sp. M1-13]|uniref:Rqc2 homolog RqcH n=1 Tax=Fructobacillus papyriferae TaxID=2713171 RepID=A0ABS5QSC1_9LACO|nr:NFACT RNA binding domain-containing protein [Fructobacillus papyriferae]MBS9334857.1 fibronectin/fibrinogen-binding protein [Fructobacillus papyriferae]MCD2158847.1 NFACT family protein [Fructobacillus papyriferae]